MVNLKKCAFLFIGLIAFIVCSGILFPESAVLPCGSGNIVSERVLIPGGQSVGIQMQVKGALIVGVENRSGPMTGDMIIAVNGKPVDGPDDVNAALDGSRATARITVIRNGETLDYAVTPYFDRNSGEYKLGFWIKEKIAGIGTMSFYDPKTNMLASLGHGIYETKTGMLVAPKEGKLLQTRVDQIVAGEKGSPGEIGGMIYNFEQPLGEIRQNTEFGLYAVAASDVDIAKQTPMVMAPRRDVKEGKAYILTTIDGTEVERFSIEITKVRRQSRVESKGLEFRVTDNELLESSGGIVQGMSGSPIIQNNRIVGAVTHVFVNDPTSGYGIFAEWMVEQIDKK